MGLANSSAFDVMGISVISKDGAVIDGIGLRGIASEVLPRKNISARGIFRADEAAIGRSNFNYIAFIESDI